MRRKRGNFEKKKRLAAPSDPALRGFSYKLRKERGHGDRQRRACTVGGRRRTPAFCCAVKICRKLFRVVSHINVVSGISIHSADLQEILAVSGQK